MDSPSGDVEGMEGIGFSEGVGLVTFVGISDAGMDEISDFDETGTSMAIALRLAEGGGSRMGFSGNGL